MRRSSILLVLLLSTAGYAQTTPAPALGPGSWVRVFSRQLALYDSATVDSLRGDTLVLRFRSDPHRAIPRSAIDALEVWTPGTLNARRGGIWAIVGGAVAYGLLAPNFRAPPLGRMSTTIIGGALAGSYAAGFGNANAARGMLMGATTGTVFGILAGGSYPGPIVGAVVLAIPSAVIGGAVGSLMPRMRWIRVAP